MSVEENKAIVRRFFEEIFNQGDLSVADEIVAADFVNHNPAPGQTPGVEGLKEFVVDLRTAFPNVVFTIDDEVAEGDKVAIRWTCRGTHEAEFGRIPATGKHVEFSALNIHRVVGGKIQEGWLKWDTLDYLQQLGVIPPLGGGE